MAYTMTYTSLVEDLKRYTERTREDDSYVIQIPRIIAMTQQMLARDFKTLGTIKVVQSNFTVESPALTLRNSVVAKPGRWRATVNFSYAPIYEGSAFTSQTATLYERTYEFCRQYWPNPSLTGLPVYYADYDYNHWLIVPTPALAHPIEISYWELPLPIDDENQTNWFTEFSPDILLIGCLLQSMPFLKNDSRMAIWQNMYDAARKSDAIQSQYRISDHSTAIRGV